MSEPAPDARLPDAVDGVLAAARRWRGRRPQWSAEDDALEHRIWLELRDLQDSRDHPGADLADAASRLLDVAPAAFPAEAWELGSAIEHLRRLGRRLRGTPS
ncbi:MAG TPA: hypothetical protein VGD72_13590 [Mycobacteriales bacterium]|jgi:hypothetical protein